MTGKLPEFKLKWYFWLTGIIIGSIVLLVSLVNASWISIYSDNNWDKFRINPVEIRTVDAQGVEKMIRYQLPQIYDKPIKNLSRLKHWRDQLWILISSGSNLVTQANLNLLLADKSVAEMIVFSQQEKIDKDYIFELAQNSIENIMKANNLAKRTSDVIESKKIKNKITEAVIVYKHIFTSIGEITKEGNKYQKLVEKIDNG